MPWSLKRYQHTNHHLHFITFSCYRRQPFLDSAFTKSLFECALERTRLGYQFFVTGYVVMPEHVHLLVSEPRGSTLASAIQALKQSVARRLAARDEHFRQKRYYDFNVWSEKKCVEKLRYIHRNPVTRGLVERPEDWAWSSFRHYVTGEPGVVEIESHWTARRRERNGDPLVCSFVKRADDTSAPTQAKPPGQQRRNVRATQVC